MSTRQSIINIKRKLVLVLLFVSFLIFADTFIKVPLCRQGKDYTCGIAAMQCILAYYINNPPSQDEMAKEAKSNRASGTKYKNLQKLAENKGCKTQIYKNEKSDVAITRLKEILDDGKPVIVLIQAWREPNFIDPISGYENDYDDGHYVVAMGYDSNNIYFMDPSTLGNYTYIPNDEFIVRWHDIDGVKQNKDNTLIHFMMVVTKEPGPVYNQDIIKDFKWDSLKN